MIPPVSDVCQKPPEMAPYTSSSRPLEYPSSLESMQCVYSIFSKLYSFLKWLFCCGRSVQYAGKPEVDPKTLPEPFRNQISEASFKAISDLFGYFGTHSYPYWIFYAIPLLKQESEISKLKLHPFEFLYYVFCNKEKIQYMIHFQQEANRGRWILQLKTGRAPWQEFLERQAANFEDNQQNLQKFLPGFCKGLLLDQDRVQGFIRKSQWKELISFVFDERKKHFINTL